MLGDDRDSVPASSAKGFRTDFWRSAGQCPDFRPVGSGGCYRPPSQRPSRQIGRWLTSHHPHPSSTTWAASCVSLCLAAKMDDSPRESVRIGGAWITRDQADRAAGLCAGRQRNIWRLGQRPTPVLVYRRAWNRVRCGFNEYLHESSRFSMAWTAVGYPFGPNPAMTAVATFDTKELW